MVHNSKHDNADIGMDFAYVVNEEENYPCENYSNQRNFANFIAHKEGSSTLRNNSAYLEEKWPKLHIGKALTNIARMLQIEDII